jgi:hypothetical protein
VLEFVSYNPNWAYAWWLEPSCDGLSYYRLMPSSSAPSVWDFEHWRKNPKPWIQAILQLVTETIIG